MSATAPSCPPWKSSTFRLHINTINHEQAIAETLPDPWPALVERGFHPDLHLRIAAWNLWCRGMQERTKTLDFIRPCFIFTRTLGQGFVSPFRRDLFPINDDDPFAALKHSALDAVSELSAFYGDRLPTLLWNTLAFIAVRDEPTQDRSIIAEVMKQNALPHHYTELDACLHALGKVYSLNFHVASVFYAHTGFVPIHNCDCGCSLHSLTRPSGGMHFEMPRENVQKASESFLTHVVSEFTTLATLQLPFELGVGDDAAAALALERDGF